MNKSWSKTLVILTVLFANQGCIGPAVPQSNEERRYIVSIPGHVLEYSIPGKLVPGYGRQLGTVIFSDNPSDPTQWEFGNNALAKTIANFYAGVVGDFEKFDVAVEIGMLKMKSPEENVGLLRDYVSQILTPPLTLKGGQKVSTLGALTIENIGGHETVVATGADMKRVARIELENGAFTTLTPYKWFFVRIDDNIVLTIKFEHFEAKHIGEKYLQDADAMAAAIVASVYVRWHG